MLRTDYRNYPSYPHGYIIHLSLGAIAASLAAIALPALLEEEYTAVTFLVLCAQQFRDIRNMERETLMKLEENTLVPRGLDYIEGIAKVFESRQLFGDAGGAGDFRRYYWGRMDLGRIGRVGHDFIFPFFNAGQLYP